MEASTSTVSVGSNTIISGSAKSKELAANLALLPNLNLFEKTPITEQVRKEHYVIVHTQNLLDENSARPGGILKYMIHGDDLYLNLAQCFFHIEVQLLKDNKPIVFSNSNVSVVNCFASSLIKNCKVSLDHHVITSSYQTFAYTQYILYLLGYDDDSKNSKLQSLCFWMDDPAHMDSVVKVSAADATKLTCQNEGLMKRREWFDANGKIELILPFNIDLARQHKFLLDKINLEVELSLNSAAFCLMYPASETFSYKINKADFYIQKLEINEAPVLALETVLKNYTAQYEYEENVCRFLTLTSGQRTYSFDPLFSGYLPIRAIVGLVTSNAVQGSGQLNPFNFQHHNIESISFVLAGRQYPFNEQKMDFSNNECLVAFQQLYRNLGCGMANNNTFGLSLNQFKSGYTLFSFNFIPNAIFENQLQVEPLRGPLRIDLRFSVAPTESLTAVLFLVFPGRCLISKYRNVEVSSSGSI